MTKTFIIKHPDIEKRCWVESEVDMFSVDNTAEITNFLNHTYKQLNYNFQKYAHGEFQEIYLPKVKTISGQEYAITAALEVFSTPSFSHSIIPIYEWDKVLVSVQINVPYTVTTNYVPITHSVKENKIEA